ncbi:hypothetical protein APHAL10511_004991 [Amanita phalloides]|nr:hypothetical protein APHAL10511_004991 [Amanita phalloides]
MLNVNFVDLWPNVAQYFESNWTMLITSILALLALISVYRSSRCLRMPKLQGPHSGSIFFGNSSKVFVSSDLSSTYRDWERMYGPVYQMPASLGTIHVVLNDPKALTHLFSKDTTTYSEPPAQRYEGRKLVSVVPQRSPEPSIEFQFGDMLITLEGETHKRIRRVLSSPLAVSAIRNITPAIFDSAYQLKGMWDSCFQSSDKLNHPVEIDIVKWMNAFTMDNVGKVAFSHDFGNLKGHPCSIMSGLDVYHAVSPTGRFLRISFYAGEAFYKLFGIIIPNARSTQLAEVAEQFKLLTTDFMTKARKAPEDSAIHKSVLGVLLRSVDPSANLRLSLPEATAQAVCISATPLHSL